MSGEDTHGSHRLFVIAFAVTVGLLGSAIYCQKIAMQRLENTEALVGTWSARLASSKSPDGRLIRFAQDAELATMDAWGRALRVRYTESQFQETVTVTSCGPDGIYISADDIMASDSNTDWVRFGKQAADTVEDVTSSVARGATKGVVSGVVSGVTDALPAPIKERLGIGEKPKPAEATKP